MSELRTRVRGNNSGSLYRDKRSVTIKCPHPREISAEMSDGTSKAKRKQSDRAEQQQ